MLYKYWRLITRLILRNNNIWYFRRHWLSIQQYLPQNEPPKKIEIFNDITKSSWQWLFNIWSVVNKSKHWQTKINNCLLVLWYITVYTLFLFGSEFQAMLKMILSLHMHYVCKVMIVTEHEHIIKVNEIGKTTIL